VATYRRPEGLERLLRGLGRQNLPEGLKVEIIVVDNDPEGSALSGAEPAGMVRWLHEPRRNIAHARNCAVDHARGTWLAFVDDDEEVRDDWIGRFWAMAESGRWDGLFGPVTSRLEREVRSWIDLETFFAPRRLPNGTPLTFREVATSNAFVKRHLFRDMRFDPAFGRTGGSDTELFGRMLDAGARFGFCAEAQVMEVIPPERYTFRWLARRAFRGGFVFTRIRRLRSPKAALWQGLPRALMALGVLAAALPFSVLGGRRTAARVALRLCVQAGHLFAFGGGHFEEYGKTLDE
jgi:glycosyltransferase involved in cell wall biosynthesis